MLLVLELVLSALVLLCLGLGSLRTEYEVILRLERRMSRYARRKRLAVLTILLLALAARLLVLPIEPIPTPGIHDEFSYLLMADTLAHGRLTNPPHPMWRHFETFHVNQQPTYCSKFFPAQGLFLALGQVVFGHPFWGVWLSTGLMCAAICWALQAWMPPGWAFLGGIIAILRLGIFNYWANSYWGGSVAALGGALVLGALPRIKRKARVQDAVLMALGLGLLANSRPYEGFFYSFPVLVGLSLWLLRSPKFPFALGVTRVVVPMAAVLVVVLLCMGYYFWRTTGSPLRTPYAVYSARYDAAPLFLWVKVKNIPHYNHTVMRQFYATGFAMQQYTALRSAPVLFVLGRTISAWLFFLGPALSLPMTACFFVDRRIHSTKLQFLLVLNAVVLAVSVPIIYFNPHYLAPATAAAYAFLLFTTRRVWVWDRRRSGRGRSVVRATIAICFFILFIKAATLRRAWVQESFVPAYSTSWQFDRAKMLARLRHERGRHLVIVRYSDKHDAHQEWVYNAADIDGSKVVWAREMGIPEDANLIAYFKDRHVWLAEPDQQPAKLTPYPTENRMPVAANFPVDSER